MLVMGKEACLMFITLNFRVVIPSAIRLGGPIASQSKKTKKNTKVVRIAHISNLSEAHSITFYSSRVSLEPFIHNFAR